MSKTSTQKKSGFDTQDIKDNIYVAALSYLWILFLVPLLLKRESKFAQSHAKQGLILFIAEMFSMLFFWLQPIHAIVVFLFIFASAYGIVQALKGEAWEVPFIGKYADKLNI